MQIRFSHYLRILLLVLVEIDPRAGQAQTMQTEYQAMYPRTDMFEPYADVTYSWDDNIFRLPSFEQVGEATGDTSWKREVGMTIDKTVGLQHFSGNVDIYKTTYDHFNIIDYVGKDAAGDWNWAIYDQFSGDVGVSYTESLTPYTQFHTQQLNLRSERREFVTASWLMAASWQLHGSLTNDDLLYDLEQEQFGDRYQHFGNVGLDFVTPQGNKYGVQVQRERGVFPNGQPIGAFLVNNDYTQDSALVDLDYTYSGLTHLTALVGVTHRYYDQFPERDISGPTAQLGVYLIPSGKFVASASVWHAINASQELTVNYTVNEGISVSPVWNVTPKIQLSGMLRAERMNYSWSTLFTPLLPQNRIDIMRDQSLTLLYSPVRRVQLTAVLYADQLDSTISYYAFRDKGAMLNLKGSF